MSNETFVLKSKSFPITLDSWDDSDGMSNIDDLWEEDESIESGFGLKKTEELQLLETKYPGITQYLNGVVSDYPEVVIKSEEDLRLIEIYYPDITTDILGCDYVFSNSALDESNRYSYEDTPGCHSCYVWVEVTESEIRLVTDRQLSREERVELLEVLTYTPSFDAECPRCLGYEPCCPICGGAGVVGKGFWE